MFPHLLDISIGWLRIESSHTNNYTISKVSKNHFMCCLVSVLVQWQLCRMFYASFSLGRCKESVSIQCEVKWITKPQQRLSNIELFLSLNKLCWIGSEGNFCLFYCFSFRVSPTHFCWLFDNFIQWFLMIFTPFSYFSNPMSTPPSTCSCIFLNLTC